MSDIFNTKDKTGPGYYGPNQTALLLLDYHKFLIENAAGPGGRPATETGVKLRNWAKSKGITVIHCLVDVHGKPFPTCKGAEMFTNVISNMATNGGEEPPSLTGGAGQDEPTFTRVPGHVSALRSPGLQEFLATKGIASLLMCGLSTSGCVLRTSTSATDAEFVVTVISDGCADPTEGVHDMLVEKVLPGRGYVATADEFIEGFEKAKGSKA